MRESEVTLRALQNEKVRLVAELEQVEARLKGFDEQTGNFGALSEEWRTLVNRRSVLAVEVESAQRLLDKSVRLKKVVQKVAASGGGCLRA